MSRRIFVMLAHFALLLLASSLADAPEGLVVGKEVYVPGPSVRLARFLTSETFSRDGRFLTYIDEGVERNYAAERARIQRGDDSASRALVRFDIQQGTKQTLYVPAADETLTRIEPIGRGGDIICTIAVGTTRENDQLVWRAIYFPVGGTPRVIADKLLTRSFEIAGSPTERRAFVLICGLSSPARYLFITPEQTVEKSLSVTGYQGGFFKQFSDRKPIAALQGPAPAYKGLGNFEFDFVTGDAFPIATLPDPVNQIESPPLIKHDSLERSKGNSKLGQSPLNDIVASAGDEKNGKGRLLVAQGIIVIMSQAANGLAVVYLRDDGTYLREMVKADAKLTERLRRESGKG